MPTNETRAEARQAPAAPDSRALRQFLQYGKLEDGLSELTLSAYQADLERYLVFLQERGRPDPAGADYALLEEFMIYLSDNLSLNPYTLARNLSALRRFHAFLAARGIAGTNPAALLDPPALRRKLPETLSAEETERLVEAYSGSGARELRDRAALELLYGCGLRVSELSKLPVSGIDFANALVRVRGKRNKERLVPVGTRALEASRAYLNEGRAALLNGKPDPGFLLLNRRGGGLSRVSLFNIIKEAARRADIRKNVSPHTLRHSFATHLVERGADIVAVKTMLGHESVTTTEVYLHVSLPGLREVVARRHPRQ